MYDHDDNTISRPHAGLPLMSWSSMVQRRMSGLERALANLAKSSSAAAVIDSASDEREGLVTCTEGRGLWLSSVGLSCNTDQSTCHTSHVSTLPSAHDLSWGG